jgi:hypothetical protein
MKTLGSRQGRAPGRRGIPFGKLRLTDLLSLPLRLRFALADGRPAGWGGQAQRTLTLACQDVSGTGFPVIVTSASAAPARFQRYR